MSDDVLVRVENVSKRFCRSLKRSLWYGLQDLGSELGGRRHGGGRGLPQSSADFELRKEEFWAVKDVSFELRRGECLGLIGHNGAGKTTLLRMLNGLIKPDTGRIEMHGQVGALIALGAGFNPALTGRENIIVNAGILGMSEKETLENIDKIIDFAEIEEFIDSPVQAYSSGMQVRLGFAIASTFQPDILIIDEILAVGDIAFKLKCIARINSILHKCAIIFVSHSLPQVTAVCNKGILMEKGALIGQGSQDLKSCIKRYLDCQQSPKSINPLIEIDPKIKSISSKIVTLNNKLLKSEIILDLNAQLNSLSVRTTLITADGTHIAQSYTEIKDALGTGYHEINIEIDASPLAPQSVSFYQTLYSERTELARITNIPSTNLSSDNQELNTYAPVRLSSRVIEGNDLDHR